MTLKKSMINRTTCFTPDDDFKLAETSRNKNDFNIRYYHCFKSYNSEIVLQKLEIYSSTLVLYIFIDFSTLYNEFKIALLLFLLLSMLLSMLLLSMTECCYIIVVNSSLPRSPNFCVGIDLADCRYVAFRNMLFISAIFVSENIKLFISFRSRIFTSCLRVYFIAFLVARRIPRASHDFFRSLA